MRVNSGLLFDVAERIDKRWFQLRRFQLCLPKPYLRLFTCSSGS
jgi:hypothetical protein